MTETPFSFRIDPLPPGKQEVVALVFEFPESDKFPKMPRTISIPLSQELGLDIAMKLAAGVVLAVTQTAAAKGVEEGIKRAFTLIA